MKHLKVVALIVITASIFGACSKYNKIIKSDDDELKYNSGIEYYKEGEYLKAYPLLEESYARYRGTSRAQELYFYYAYCDYHLGDYQLSGHRFESYHKRYKSSPMAEEALFMSAYCHYKDSPRYSLDQSDTKIAIDRFQYFINQYPQSTRIDSCNGIMDNLRSKLETKYYEIAYLYLKTENFKAGIQAFENFIQDFPDSKYREAAHFYLFKSQYALALNSVEAKKIERYAQTMNTYIKFVDLFPKSEYIKEAEILYEKSETELKRLEKNKLVDGL